MHGRFKDYRYGFFFSKNCRSLGGRGKKGIDCSKIAVTRALNALKSVGVAADGVQFIVDLVGFCGIDLVK